MYLVAWFQTFINTFLKKGKEAKSNAISKIASDNFYSTFAEKNTCIL